VRGVHHEERLAATGIRLPPPARPAAQYVPCVRTGNLLYVSGQGPVTAEGFVAGKVGLTLDEAAAKHAARLTGLAILAAVRQELGSLDRVTRVVKILGMVNCAPGFNRMPAVIDGCSELFLEVFGDAGRHARSAVGMAELPFDIAVEIEAIFEVA
jgi:enamine deaminase RidA (YjgF/YER057c/UK114 family)